MRIPFPVRAVPTITFRAWLTPPPISKRALERDRAATAGLTPFLTGDTTGFEVGSGPLALALHGWGGRPAQMAPVAERLAGSGYRVIIPELPGHAGGAATDIKQAAAAVRSVIRDEIPAVVVVHSFGAMVGRLVFDKESPKRMVLFAPALTVADALRVFGDRARLFPWARRGLRRRLERWDPALWPTIAELAPGQFPGSGLLIVHDPDDEEAPFGRSAELAAIRPATTLHVARGVGHAKVLSDPEVLEAMESWVQSTAPVEA